VEVWVCLISSTGLALWQAGDWVGRSVDSTKVLLPSRWAAGAMNLLRMANVTMMDNISSKMVAVHGADSYMPQLAYESGMVFCEGWPLSRGATGVRSEWELELAGNVGLQQDNSSSSEQTHGVQDAGAASGVKRKAGARSEGRSKEATKVERPWLFLSFFSSTLQNFKPVWSVSFFEVFSLTVQDSLNEEKKLAKCAKVGGAGRKGTSDETKLKAERTTSEQSGDGVMSPRSKAVQELHPKQDFIHVRARRGQATDSHSLAERVKHPIASPAGQNLAVNFQSTFTTAFGSTSKPLLFVTVLWTKFNDNFLFAGTQGENQRADEVSSRPCARLQQGAFNLSTASSCFSLLLKIAEAVGYIY
jgi:hypothetical protein